MNFGCACTRSAEDQRERQQQSLRSDPWQFSFDECRRFRGGGLLEKRVDRRALDQPALVDEQHLVAEAARLAEVVRGHDDLGARGVEGLDRRSRSRASRRGSRLAVGSSRNSTSGCSAQARASASRCCSPPESTRAGRCARSARPTSRSAVQGLRFALGRRHAARAPARRRCWRAPSGAASPGAGTPSPARAARAPDPPVPGDLARRSARAGRASGASARSCRRRWRPG